MPNTHHPVVLILGVNQTVELRTPGKIGEFETDFLSVVTVPNDTWLRLHLYTHRPHVIITVGKAEDFPNMLAAPWSVRRKWFHMDSLATEDDRAKAAFNVVHCLLGAALDPMAGGIGQPLVSVITPAYNRGKGLLVPYKSLLDQTYTNWEWVVVDDSNHEDDGDTLEWLTDLRDDRIRIYRGAEHNGRVGDVKRAGFGLARGHFLVELDHDDALMPTALEHIVAAFQKYPEVGFVYSDWAECWEDDPSKPIIYPSGWGHGYGQYRDETHDGIPYKVAVAPNINPKTIRHIVAAPNHVRAWRANVYFDLGGHNPAFSVADDYELLVRTFLHTRMARIPYLEYVQYRVPTGNTHQHRNQEIQRMVRWLSNYYDRQIHDRFVALGVDDFVFNPDPQQPSSFFRLNMPNPEVEPHCTILADVAPQPEPLPAKQKATAKAKAKKKKGSK